MDSNEKAKKLERLIGNLLILNDINEDKLQEIVKKSLIRYKKETIKDAYIINKDKFINKKKSDMSEYDTLGIDGVMIEF